MNVAETDSDVVDALVRQFVIDFPKDAAAQLDQLDRDEAAQLLADLPFKNMVAAWEAMSAHAGSEVLLRLAPDTCRELAQHADIGKFSLLLSRMNDESREAILGNLDEADARDIRAMMQYPTDSAGQLMDTRILTFRETQTVAEAVAVLKDRHPHRSISVLRIVDDAKKLTGLVKMADLALADEGQSLDSLSSGVIAAVFPMDPRDDVVEKLNKYGLEELPVIDNDGVLLGVIRHSELLNALRESATLDVQTMVGASKDERATSSSWFAVRRRMPWLQVNLLTAFLAAAVVGLFEGTIAKVTALAVLLPVVAGQSGNAGAQALAVTMRGLALREIRVANWLKVMRKEMNAGFWNGVSIAVTCAIGVYVWSNSVGLVIVIAVSMVISMVMAGIAGALVPITLARLGQDPAVASSIVLTTVTDIAGFFSFLGIATLLMSMLT